MHDFLESMKADIANVQELVNKFNDPYGASSPVSEVQGTNENENNNSFYGFYVDPNAPNGFLEKID